MIKIYSLDEAVEKGLFINKNMEKIFITGAGISNKEPSSLPLGAPLTDFYLRTAIGSQAADYVSGKWEEFSELIYQDTGRSFPFLRLEIIVDNVNKMERKMDIKGMIGGFDRFTECSSNYNHRLLYQLALKGNMILTANFDTAIENAYSEIHRFQRGYELQCPILYNYDNVKIYHFHGIPNINNNSYYMPEYTLGTTVENIKSGFPKLLGAEMSNRMQQGWQTIFLGYSGSDFFDVTPFFENMPDIETGTAIWFVHNLKPIGEQMYRCEKILRNFKTAYIVYGDTTLFLEILSGHSGHQEDELFLQKGKFNWKQTFQGIQSKYSSSQYELVLIENGLRILNQISLNYRKCYTNWEERLKYLLDYLLTENNLSVFYTEPDLSSTIVADLNSTCENGRNSEPEKASFFWREYIKMNDILAQKRRHIISPVAAANKTGFEQLLKIVNNGEIKPENYNSRTVYAINRHAKEYIRRWVRDPKDSCINTELRLLSTALDRMLSMPYNQYMYMSYYITLLKLKNIIVAILNPEYSDSDMENFMLEIAMEINCTSQVEKVYKNWARKQLILYKQTNKMIFLEKAKHYYNMMAKISKICEREVSQKDIISLGNIL